MDRIILHCDCNAFFASVEEQIHPKYKEVPMAVCGDPENRRGIILAKNELAKGYKIQTAETVWQALQKCPQLTLTPPRRGLYGQYCKQINAIYEQYTDLVECFGIDESFLDVTGSIHLFGGDPYQLAHEIRKRVERETGLTISIGLSFNRIFAKLGSDYKKPNAVTQITPQNYKELLWPLPVSAMFMVGKTTEENLARFYIRTIGDLAHSDPRTLQTRLGKMGETLHRYANGLDNSPVSAVRETMQSVGNGITFRRDLVTLADIRSGISALSDSVASRLREAGFKCATVQLHIKDTSLKVITRQRALESPTWLAQEIAKTALEIVQDSWRIGVPIRMLTVTAQKLIPAEDAAEQLSLFAGETQRNKRKQRENLEQAMDHVRQKFGDSSLVIGSIVHNDIGIEE